MSYLYAGNRDPFDRTSQIEILLDDGSTAMLSIGRYYDLTSGELARARHYINLVQSNTPADSVPIGIEKLPILGNPNDGDVPTWSVAQAAFVPEPPTGGTGGGITVQDEGSSLTARSKLNFTGAGVAATDNAGNGSTDVSISGAGVSDASTTVKGVTKLASAPATPSNPIAVGDNDTRVTADQVAGTASIRTLGTGAQQAAVGSHTHVGLSVQAVGTASVRSLGTGATDAAAGNDSRLSNTRTPSAASVALSTLASDALLHLKAVVYDSGSGYGSRPTGFASVEFIGASDPGGLAQNGDTWIPTA